MKFKIKSKILILSLIITFFIFIFSFLFLTIYKNEKLTSNKINLENSLSSKNNKINHLKTKNITDIEILNDFSNSYNKQVYTEYIFNQNNNSINSESKTFYLVKNHNKLNLKLQRLVNISFFNYWYWSLAGYNELTNCLLLPSATSDLTTYNNKVNILDQDLVNILIEAISKVYPAEYQLNYFLKNNNYSIGRNMWGGPTFADFSKKEHCLPIPSYPIGFKSRFNYAYGPSNYIETSWIKMGKLLLPYLLFSEVNQQTINEYRNNEVLKPLCETGKKFDTIYINTISNKFRFGITPYIFDNSNLLIKILSDFYRVATCAWYFESEDNFKLYDFSLDNNYMMVPQDFFTTSTYEYDYFDGEVNKWGYFSQKPTAFFKSLPKYIVGYQNLLNSYQKIYIDFTDLIQIKPDTYYNNQGNQWTTNPKIKFGFNNELFECFKEISLISNLVNDIVLNANNILKISTSFKDQLINLIDDVYNKRIGYFELNNYATELKRSNGHNIGYNKVNSTNVAKYEQILRKYNFNLSTSNKPFIDQVNDISNWRLMYEQALPTIFSNDIWATFRQKTNNGTYDIVTQKVYDGQLKQFVDYNVKSYSQQINNFDNNIDVEITDIYMKRPSNNEIISSSNYSANSTLTLKNIFNISPITQKQKIKLNGNTITCSFCYNPTLNSNMQLQTTPKTFSLLNLGNQLVFDIGDQIGKLEFMPLYKDRLGDALQIPQSIWSKYEENIHYGNNWTNVLFESNPSVMSYARVPDSTLTLHPDLKTWLEYYQNWRDTQYIDYNDPFYEQQIQIHFDWWKKLQDLHYIYANFSFRIPLDYYMPKTLYEKLIANGSIVFLGIDKSKAYNYAFKFEVNGTILDINKLQDYISVYAPIENIEEKADLVQIKERISQINTAINQNNIELSTLKNSLNNFKNIFDNLILNIKADFDNFLNVNEDIKIKYTNIVQNNKNSYETIINELKENFKKFNETDESKLDNLFWYKEDKTFNYINQLNELKNIVSRTTNLINTLLETDPNFLPVKTTIVSKFNEFITLLNNAKNTLQKLLTNFQNLKNQYLEQQQRINNFKDLHYSYLQKIEFNMQKLYADTKRDFESNDDTSSVDDFFVSWQDQTRISMWFGVSPINFVKKLNEVIKQKTGVDFKLRLEQFNGSCEEKNPTYFPLLDPSNSPFDNCENGLFGNCGHAIEGVYTYFDYVVEKNRVKKCVFNIRFNTSESIEKLHHQNQRSIETCFQEGIKDFDNTLLLLKSTDQSINQITNNILDIQQKLNSINFKNNKLLNDIQNKIDNYTPINVTSKTINIGAVVGFVIMGLVLIGLSTGLGIYFKSKKQLKIKEPDDETKEKIEQEYEYEQRHFND